MAVNLSPRQFADADLLKAIEGALAQSGMPARLLEIEITESMAMHDYRRSEKLIRAIRDTGASVAIDDFGAGHSSMGRLKHLSIDTIKIDRSFVQGIVAEDKDRAIVEAIVTIGRALKLNLVGEGSKRRSRRPGPRTERSIDLYRGRRRGGRMTLRQTDCAAPPRCRPRPGEAFGPTPP
jgi:EAL domain-containing protein (putative c-di-GMP-specific phosphodiesterase class I)